MCPNMQKLCHSVALSFTEMHVVMEKWVILCSNMMCLTCIVSGIDEA